MYNDRQRYPCNDEAFSDPKISGHGPSKNMGIQLLRQRCGRYWHDYSVKDECEGILEIGLVFAMAVRWKS